MNKSIIITLCSVLSMGLFAQNTNMSEAKQQGKTNNMSEAKQKYTFA